MTTKGEERIGYLADREKGEAERKQRQVVEERKQRQAEKERRAIEERKQSGMYLHEVIAEGLPREIEKRVRSEFNIISIDRLGSKRLNEIALPQKIWKETGLLRLKGERKLGYLELPLRHWLEILKNISKPAPKPQHLSPEEVLILTALPKQKKGDFLVTKDGEVLYARGKGYLTLGAAAILAQYRRAKRTG